MGLLSMENMGSSSFFSSFSDSGSVGAGTGVDSFETSDVLRGGVGGGVSSKAEIRRAAFSSFRAAVGPVVLDSGDSALLTQG